VQQKSERSDFANSQEKRARACTCCTANVFFIVLHRLRSALRMFDKPGCRKKITFYALFKLSEILKKSEDAFFDFGYLLVLSPLADRVDVGVYLTVSSIRGISEQAMVKQVR